MADRHTAHAYNYESALVDPETRQQNIEDGTDDKGKHFDSGYTTGKYSVWKRRLDKAVHIAVRTHAAAGENNYRSIPNADVLGAGGNDGHEMILGHLYHHHDHVRKVIDKMGFTDVAQAAAEKYRNDSSDGARNLRDGKPSPFHRPVTTEEHFDFINRNRVNNGVQPHHKYALADPNLPMKQGELF